MFRHRFSLLAGLLAVLAVTAPAQGQDVADNVHWDGRFGVPGNSFNTASPVAVSNGRVYVAGLFGCFDDTGAAATCALAIREADGQWHFDAPAAYGPDGEFKTILVAGDFVYLGGTFTTIGGQPFNHVAEWDGTQWLSVGDGFDGGVDVLYADEVGFYAGGAFSHSGETAIDNIAVWDGNSWEPLPDVNGGIGVSARVTAITSTSSHLYLGGRFSSAGGLTGVHNVVEYNWTTDKWTRMDTGLGPDGRDVYALGASGNTVYAAGTFVQTGDGTMPIPSGVASWNGTAWTPMGQNQVGVSGLYVSPRSVIYAAGDFSAEGGEGAAGLAVWNGTEWAPVGPGLGQTYAGIFMKLAGEGEDLYAPIGLLGDGRDLRGLGKWDGSQWSSLQEGISVLGAFEQTKHVQSLAYTQGKLYAAGRYGPAGSIHVHGIAQWDGVQWAPVGEPPVDPNDPFDTGPTVLAAAGDDLYAAGNFTEIGGVAANRVARWDGTAWHAMGDGPQGGIYTLYADGSDVYAGGRFVDANGLVQDMIRRWDGTAWQPIGSYYTTTSTRVEAIAKIGDRLYIGGILYKPDGTGSAVNVAMWDGTSWAAVGDGVGGDFDEVTALAVVNGELYAALRVPPSGGTGSVFRWNGSNWVEIGAFDRDRVNVLFANGNDLYVGGNFTSVNDTPAYRIAKWDGTSWSGLGTGIGIGAGANAENVLALLGTPDGLYAAGSFTEAGGKPSFNIARWDDFTLVNTAVEPDDPTSDAPFSVVYPNPFHGSATVVFNVPAAQHVRAAVYDVLGRQVALLYDGSFAGEKKLTLEGASLPSGIYFIRITADSFARTERVILLR
ncbi:MAG TPA: T9SS type A sorting domain-containing protein [Rhodothermales bacterium]|nr:T9SS type A sorting domain-containing protein [Rhodothermales bacterium]